MDINRLLEEISSYAAEHPLLTAVVLLIVLYAAHRRRGLFITLALVIVIMAGVYALIMDSAFSGKSHKQVLIKKTDQHHDSPR